MSILLTDPHVERCVTLLALMQCSTNTVEFQRYHGRYKELLRFHPEVSAIEQTDPRVQAAITELRAAFEPTAPPIPERSTEPDEIAEAFDYLGDYDDSQEFHARRDR